VGAWPGVNTRVLEVSDVEPLRAEIESFLEAARTGGAPAVTGADGRRSLSLATRVLERIHEHPVVAGLTAGG
jgi:predicted dehydrogenase